MKGVVFAAHRDRYTSSSGPFSLLKVLASWLMYKDSNNTTGLLDGMLFQDGYVSPARRSGGHLLQCALQVYYSVHIKVSHFLQPLRESPSSLSNMTFYSLYKGFCRQFHSWSSVEEDPWDMTGYVKEIQ